MAKGRGRGLGRGHGSGWGRGSSGTGGCLGAVLLIVSTLFLLSTLAFTLVARLYLKTYYTAAHAAALSVFVGLFLLVHHTAALRRSLGLSFGCFRIWETILNTIYFLATLASAVCNTVLAVWSVTFSYDLTGACALTWVNALILVYMLVAGAKKRHDYTISPNYTGAMFTNEIMEMRYLDDGIIDREKERAHGRSGCCRCIVGFTRFLLWLVYLLVQLLLVFFFVLGTYQAASSIRDIHRYRKDSEMYKVKVGFHDQQALYMRCRGNGSETIIFENGLASSLFLNWAFVPTYVSESYRVCGYNRRGYGWSESYENDPPGMLLREKQWARPNVDFFKALMDAANMTKPFYYAGYSYGGYHITYMAMLYPEYIKGLIYLDASRLSSIDVNDLSYEQAFELLANFIPSGLFRLILDTGLYDIEGVFIEALDTTDIPQALKDEFLASVASNLYPQTALREMLAFDDAEEVIQTELSGVQIYKPVVVIDAGFSDDWLPHDSFPLYDPSTDFFAIEGASHETFMHTAYYGRMVADRVIQFVSEQSGEN